MDNREKSGLALNRLLPWIIPVVFVAGWLIVAEMRILPAYLLPHPVDILDCGYAYIFGSPGDGMYAGRFLTYAGASMVRVGVGFAVAATLGIPLGVMSGRLPVVDRLLSTSVNGIRAVPGISWLPLALIWFGIGLKTTVFLVALAAFFPIYINSASGVRQVSPVLLQAGAMMGIRSLRGTFAILLPSAMPYIISGLRLGLGISWAYLVLGELTGVTNGLGAVIMDARMVGRIDVIIVGIIIIAVIGRLSDQLLDASMKFCLKSARRSA
ncbi:MAG TPA: ABC transporter permease [Desulfosalsimonadaceae bacterium]|nr:ABC transporter permease [Desulfosalsimonadaceae bacterium]